MIKVVRMKQSMLIIFPKTWARKSNIYGLSSGMGLWIFLALPQAWNPRTVLLSSAELRRLP